MKKSLTILALLLCLTNIKAQFVTIPDANFVTWLQAHVPSAMNGSQMDTTSLAVVNKTSLDLRFSNIWNLTGIKFFKNLDTLVCRDNFLSTLPIVSDSIKYLDCNNNQLTSITIFPSSLKEFKCRNNFLITIPPLPNTIESLDCFFNQLTSLPNLPNGLKILECGVNQLQTLPSLPNSLMKLNCSSNLISNIVALPNSLTYIDCSGNLLTNLPPLSTSTSTLFCYLNQITQLPTLPNSLTLINSHHNQIISLPLLPNALSKLDVSNNLIQNLPNLPNSILAVSCTKNQISNISNLPVGLVSLRCDSNIISSLPPLPSTLLWFDCSHNNISCFNNFPDNNYNLFKISDNPFTCLPNYFSNMNTSLLNYPLCILGTSYNPNNCNNANGIFGSVYNDTNVNCTKNLGEQNIINNPIKLFDNSNVFIGQTSTLSNGLFYFSVPTGTYSIIVDTINKPYYIQCLYPGNDSTVTANPSHLIDSIDFAVNCKSGYDAGIQSINHASIVFPGQQHAININAGDVSHWYNLNCASGLSGVLSFTINGPATYVGPALGSLTPSTSGNTYTYNIPDFGTINNTTDFKLIFQTNTSAQAGDSVCIYASITPTSGDNNLSNNSYNYCYSVVNSYDPNIKEVYPIDVQPGFNDWLTYTIYFQNTGNAPAYNIRLADTLDTMLNLETFQVINYSHQNIIDLTGNILNIRFPNIMLPDSTINPSGSIGFVQYRIKPKATWAAPYKIKNTAYIYFDFNSPIVTNTTYNSILDISTGLTEEKESIASVYPNPTNGNFIIELNTKEKQSLQLFDMTGNVVLSQTIENGKANIDANYLAAGVYNMSIKGNASVINQKLVIVK